MWCCLLRALLFPLSDHANDLALLALESEGGTTQVRPCLPHCLTSDAPVAGWLVDAWLVVPSGPSFLSYSVLVVSLAAILASCARLRAEGESTGFMIMIIVQGGPPVL